MAHPRTIAGVTLCVAPHGGRMVVGRRARGTARGREREGVAGLGGRGRGRGGGEGARSRRDRPRPFARGRGPIAPPPSTRQSVGSSASVRGAGTGSPARRRRAPGVRGRRAFLRPREALVPSSSVATSAPAATSAHRVSTWTAAIDAARRPRPRRARMPSDGDACAARGGQCGRTPRATSTARVGRLEAKPHPPPSTPRGCVEGTARGEVSSSPRTSTVPRDIRSRRAKTEKPNRRRELSVKTSVAVVSISKPRRLSRLRTTTSRSPSLVYHLERSPSPFTSAARLPPPPPVAPAAS